MGKKDIINRYLLPTEHITNREKGFIEGLGSLVIGGSILTLLYIGIVFIYNGITDAISYTIGLITENFFWIKVYSYTIFFITTVKSSIRSYEYFKKGFKNEYSSQFELIKSELKVFFINYIALFMLPILGFFQIIALLILLKILLFILAVLSDHFSIIDSFTIDSYFNFLSTSWDFVFKQK